MLHPLSEWGGHGGMCCAAAVLRKFCVPVASEWGQVAHLRPLPALSCASDQTHKRGTRNPLSAVPAHCWQAALAGTPFSTPLTTTIALGALPVVL